MNPTEREVKQGLVGVQAYTGPVRGTRIIPGEPLVLVRIGAQTRQIPGAGASDPSRGMIATAGTGSASNVAPLAQQQLGTQSIQYVKVRGPELQPGSLVQQRDVREAPGSGKQDPNRGVSRTEANAPTNAVPLAQQGAAPPSLHKRK